MSTARHPRRRGRERPPRTVAGLRPVRSSPPVRDAQAISVQLLPSHLAAAELPPAVVGDELEVSPVIYVGGHRPAVGTEADRWEVDELGGLAARGALLHPGVSGPSGRPDVLDADGRLHPVNWAASDSPTGARIDLEGALYLDPEVLADGAFGDAVGLCRRWYRVGAIRRYRRTLEGPRAPVDLRAVPEPAEVSDAAVYVADLVPLPEAEPSAAW